MLGNQLICKSLKGYLIITNFPVFDLGSYLFVSNKCAGQMPLLMILDSGDRPSGTIR